jgi:NAD(P)-dependent dehydrogenase (short-subunit alcohol dehydrogenase family)
MRVQDLFDLRGRTALVTGGGRGIGRHIAVGLAEAGADVAIASRRLENCEETARALEKLGRRALALRADLADEGEIAALAERTLEEFGRLHILVNNAGITWGAPTLEYPIEGWDRVFDVNVRGLWILTQRIARHMVEAGGGAILNVTSISGYRGASEEAEPAIAYSASKAAVTTLTKDLAVKLAPHRIRVNALAPGPFRTQMLDWVSKDDATLREFLKAVPLGRTGEEDDVKGVALFLVSDAAAFVTGTTVVVDGGMLAGVGAARP